MVSRFVAVADCGRKLNGTSECTGAAVTTSLIALIANVDPADQAIATSGESRILIAHS